MRDAQSLAGPGRTRKPAGPDSLNWVNADNKKGGQGRLFKVLCTGLSGSRSLRLRNFALQLERAGRQLVVRGLEQEGIETAIMLH